MSFKVKRWGSLGQIDVTDFYAGAHGGLGGADVNSYVFSFAGRLIFLCYEGASGVNDPIYFTYDPATEEWTGPHDGSAVQDGCWSWNSVNYGDSAEYQVWGASYLVGYGMAASIWTGGPCFVTIGTDFVLSTWDPPSNPFGGMNVDKETLRYHPGVGVDEAGEPARLASWTAREWLAEAPWFQSICKIYRYGPGGTALLYEGLFDDVFWSVDPIDHSPYFSGVPVGPVISWYIGSSSTCGGLVEGFLNLYASPPPTGTECSPLATIEPTRWFRALGTDTWGVVSERTAEVPNGALRWAPVTVDAREAGAPPWSGTWDYRRMRDGLGYTVNQGDVDGIDHAADPPIVGEPSYNSGLGWYVGSSSETGLSVTLYVLDPWPPAGMTRRLSFSGTDAIGWIGECAIRPNLRVEDVLPADRPYPLKLGGSVVERTKGGYRLTAGAIVKGVLSTAPSVDVSSYPVTDPDWTWGGSEDGRVEQMGWSSFAEGPDDTMLWGGMPDYMWGMWYMGLKRWMGLGTLLSENLAASGGAPTHVLSTASAVAATNSVMQPLPDNYENAPDQLIGWPDFPDGPIVCYFGSCTRQNTIPYWKAVVWRVTGGAWSELVQFKAMGPPGLGETDWTVWSIAPIRGCRGLPQGGFLVGATLYFAPWADWESTPGSRDATFLDTGLGYVPGKPGNQGPIPVEHVPVYLTCEPFSGGRSLYGPDALLVYDHEGTFVTHLNTAELYPPDGRQVLVTREGMPRVIYKVYREGTYSDFAEGWGAYHRFTEDAETQTGLYVCYDLLDQSGQIAPGLGRCHGFLDMYGLGAAQDADWRWSVPGGLYDALHPRDWWIPPGRSQMRMGLGGMTLTPLAGGPTSSRGGVRGVGSRA